MMSRLAWFNVTQSNREFDWGQQMHPIQNEKRVGEHEQLTRAENNIGMISILQKTLSPA